MAGQKILTESPSFYTDFTKQARLAVSKEIDELKKNLVPRQMEKLPLEVPRINKNELLTQNQRSEEEMNQLDAILPKTEAEKASIRELNSLLNQNKKEVYYSSKLGQSDRGGDH